MRTSINRYTRVLAGAGWLFSTSVIAIGGALAQDSVPATSPVDRASADIGFGDIVVTARKRAESLINVPVAVTAIGGEMVQRAAATDLTSIAKLAPQLTISRADSGSAAAVSLPGIGPPHLVEEIGNVP